MTLKDDSNETALHIKKAETLYNTGRAPFVFTNSDGVNISPGVGYWRAKRNNDPSGNTCNKECMGLLHSINNQITMLQAGKQAVLSWRKLNDNVVKYLENGWKDGVDSGLLKTEMIDPEGPDNWYLVVPIFTYSPPTIGDQHLVDLMRKVKSKSFQEGQKSETVQTADKAKDRIMSDGISAIEALLDACKYNRQKAANTIAAIDSRIKAFRSSFDVVVADYNAGMAGFNHDETRPAATTTTLPPATRLLPPTKT